MPCGYLKVAFEAAPSKEPVSPVPAIVVTVILMVCALQNGVASRKKLNNAELIRVCHAIFPETFINKIMSCMVEQGKCLPGKC
jgi:hypothetical protein